MISGLNSFIAFLILKKLMKFTNAQTSQKYFISLETRDLGMLYP
ncbi:MAG: hypothetical protein WCG25_06250 [bacterium]